MFAHEHLDQRRSAQASNGADRRRVAFHRRGAPSAPGQRGEVGRETGFEPATFCLANTTWSWCRPHPDDALAEAQK